VIHSLSIQIHSRRSTALTEKRDNKLQAILQSREVDDLLKASVKESVKKHLPVKEEPHVNEAYVTQVKPYGQVTEFLTQKTKDAHSRLYQGYVETLNRVSAELDSMDRSEVGSRDFHSAKSDESFYLNAVWLHELYFANCFDPNSTVYMDSLSFLKLQATWGNFEDWQRDFMACAMSSGDGWVVCGYHLFLRRYVNTIVKDHSDSVLLGLFPVIVVDMHEHAYMRDYLDDKKSYLVSQMREINWDVVSTRFEIAERLAQVVK
jgi:Fe-Mn family superoxide dismutase